ncbi:hypothetical protein MJI37_29375, partial [Salmonella enterica subsp. enterica serovar Cerro]|nr:hypothetical protein [Salmonella enterica subsp. enterica serovar Cerro]
FSDSAVFIKSFFLSLASAHCAKKEGMDAFLLHKMRDYYYVISDERVTVQSLDVVRVDAERNLLLVKGGVPGATGCDLIVKPAVKA